MSDARTVARYLTALGDNDRAQIEALLSEDFTFLGPGMRQPLDKRTFLDVAGAKYENVGALRVLRQVEEDGEVASLYEVDAETSAASATLLLTEWNTVRDGRVASALVVMDTAAGAPLHAH